MGMLDRGNAEVSLDGIGTRHMPYGVKRSWGGSIQGDYVWTVAVVQGEVAFVDFILRADLVIKLGGCREYVA